MSDRRRGDLVEMLEIGGLCIGLTLGFIPILLAITILLSFFGFALMGIASDLAPYILPSAIGCDLLLRLITSIWMFPATAFAVGLLVPPIAFKLTIGI